MNKLSFKQLGLRLALLAMLALPELVNGAQFFNYNVNGDVLLGFRKTDVNAGQYELVVNLGSVTNILNLPVGTTTNITQYTTGVLTNAFGDTGSFDFLQWSAFSSFQGSLSPWITPLGSFPAGTMWLTRPSTDISTQSPVPNRSANTTQNVFKQKMFGVGNNANQISINLGTTNVNNNIGLVREPVTETLYILTAFIGDANDNTIGNFGSGGTALPYVVENTTPEPFSSAQRIDFYQLCPSGTTDPLNGSSTATYHVGYFILSPNGSMTFTRTAQTAAAPVAGFTGGPTNGFAGFTALFTNVSTGSITNWIWNFGDGTTITNTAGTNVSHAYAAGGNYNVTLTVAGPGGFNAQVQSSFIVASPQPTMTARALPPSQVVLSGSNCPVGLQYRILNSTNVAANIGSWIPIKTNLFLSDGTFSFTNSAAQTAGFFRLVSP